MQSQTDISFGVFAQAARAVSFCRHRKKPKRTFAEGESIPLRRRGKKMLPNGASQMQAFAKRRSTTKFQLSPPRLPPHRVCKQAWGVVEAATRLPVAGMKNLSF